MGAPPKAAAPGCSSCRSRSSSAIFYFIILLPMKRKQQKVQEFSTRLKVGDRVDHHRRHLRADHAARTSRRVQLQIADKVRIEVAQAAIGGYQGQAPVVETRSESRRAS